MLKTFKQNPQVMERIIPVGTEGVSAAGRWPYTPAGKWGNPPSEWCPNWRVWAVEKLKIFQLPSLKIRRWHIIITYSIMNRVTGSDED